MRVFVPKESRAGERRVALIPDVISKLTRAGFEVVVANGAGDFAGASDTQFVTAGAKIGKLDEISSADVILSVQPLTPNQFASLKSGSLTISFLSPRNAEAYNVKAKPAATNGANLRPSIPRPK